MFHALRDIPVSNRSSVQARVTNSGRRDRYLRELPNRDRPRVWMRRHVQAVVRFPSLKQTLAGTAVPGPMAAGKS